MRWQGWRRRIVRGITVLAISFAVLLTWGVAIEPRFILDHEAHEVVLPGLPGALDRTRVAVIADVQIGMWLTNRSMVRHSVQEIIELRPDVVLIAGDFIYDWSDDDVDEQLEEREEDLRERANDIRDVVDMLRPLGSAGLPTFAVLGNHDYGMMWPTSPPLPHVALAVEGALKSIGITVLRNESRRMNLAGSAASHSLYIVGIDAHAAHRDNIAAALQAVPEGAPRLALMHNPASFAAFPPATAPLAIAGHTHGGQVRLPFLPRWSWMTLAEDEPVHADGWIADFGALGNHLYVNRGIGFSTVPVRINCPPELTVFTLRAP